MTRGDLQPGSTERLAIGPVSCLLVPRALERPADVHRHRLTPHL
jgi:hypothetical protein